MIPSKSKRFELAPPQEVCLMTRSVLGRVDLDPYSTPLINRMVLAARIFNRELEDFDSILSRDWPMSGERRLFVGSPAGAEETRRLAHRALREYRSGRAREVILWIGHNETLTRAPWIWDFPVCFPFRRVRPMYYDDEMDRFRPVTPAHWSFVVYMPPTDTPAEFNSRLARFHVSFSALGRVVFNQFSGEDDWVDAYKVLMKKNYDFRS